MATITSLGANDSGSTSRTTINTNFTNLNTDKLESSVIQRIYKSADETVNNSNTLQNDDALTFAIGANEVWGFQACVRLTSGATPDIRFAWSIPTAATMAWGDDDAIATEKEDVNVTGPTAYTLSGSANRIMGFHGVVFGGANAGNVTLQWAQNTNDPSDTKVLKGSHIIAHKLA